MGKIVVIGSANTDLVVKTDRMPSPGETILGGSFMMSGGGKGANQAVAASRLGGKVTFVARVGNDLFGERALAGYRAERLDVRHVTRDATVPSGVALICVDGAAENSIVVAPGANERLSPEDVDRAEAEIAAADFVVLQLEIPLPAVMRAAEVAERHGVRVILNPAPAAAIPDELLRRCYLLTPNRGECAMLTGMPVADAAGAERGGRRVAGARRAARGGDARQRGRTRQGGGELRTGGGTEGRGGRYDGCGRHLQRCAGRGAFRRASALGGGAFRHGGFGDRRHAHGRPKRRSDARRGRCTAGGGLTTMHVRSVRRGCDRIPTSKINENPANFRI